MINPLPYQIGHPTPAWQYEHIPIQVAWENYFDVLAFVGSFNNTQVEPWVGPHLSLCKGQVLELVPSVSPIHKDLQESCEGRLALDESTSTTNAGGGYPVGSPSLLGDVYIASHDGGRRLMAGATKEYDVAPEVALKTGEATNIMVLC